MGNDGSRWIMLLLASLALGVVAVTAGAQMPSGSGSHSPYADDMLKQDNYSNPASTGGRPLDYVTQGSRGNVPGYKVLKPGMHRVAKSKDPSVLPVSDAGGFIGADAAYSKLMADGRRIWAFGDTLVGDLANGRRAADMQMYRNSLAVETKEGEFVYYWGSASRNEKSGGQGAFTNKRQGEWYWPGDFVVADKTAYFFLRRMKQTGNDVFGFKTVGVDMAVVTNLDAGAKNWKINYIPLPEFDANGLIPGIAAVRHNNDIILLATIENPNHPFYLARLSEKQIELKNYKVEYFDFDSNAWGISLPETPLMPKGSPEASLYFNKSNEQWRMVYSRTGLSSDIVMRESTELTNGWGDEVVLYSCPETTWKSDYFCYAGKEIPDRTEGMAITYSVNSFNTKDLNADARIYVPRVISVNAPFDPNATPADSADTQGVLPGEDAEVPPVKVTKPSVIRPNAPEAQLYDEGAGREHYDHEGNRKGTDDTMSVSPDGYMFTE